MDYLLNRSIEVAGTPGYLSPSISMLVATVQKSSVATIGSIAGKQDRLQNQEEDTEYGWRTREDRATFAL